MPNHIMNQIEIEGTKEQVDAIVEKYGTIIPEHFRRSWDDNIICNSADGDYGWLNEETNVFSRRNEEDVQGLPEGWTKEVAEECLHFPDFQKVFPMPKEVEASKDEMGMSPAWYTWSVENWGSKWNCYDCIRVSDTVFQFQTAWSGVPKILDEISLNFPDIEIDYKWSDEDTGSNCAIIRLSNGIVDEYYLDNQSNEAYNLAFELRPECEEYYHKVDGIWEYNEEAEEE